MAVMRAARARGEVHLVRLDPTLGSEIQKTRPCLVVSPINARDSGTFTGPHAATRSGAAGEDDAASILNQRSGSVPGWVQLGGRLSRAPRA